MPFSYVSQRTRKGRGLAGRAGLLWACLMVVGCQPGASTPDGSPTLSPPAAVTAQTLPDAPSDASPRQPVSLAVPAEWTDIAASAVRNLNHYSITWVWQLVPAVNPHESLAQGQVQVALVGGEEGVIVRREPLVLAVPFTTAWEGVSYAEAQDMLAQDPPPVTVSAWADLSPTNKALHVDGYLPGQPGYPLQAEWSLVGAPGYDSAIVELAVALEEAAPDEPVVRLAAVGDVVLDRALGEALAGGDLEAPFAGVADPLSAADVAVGNLESSLGEASTGEPASKQYTFRAPPQAAPALAMAGFDVLSLANNHVLDYGPDTLLAGMALLHEQGIATAGTGSDEGAAHAPHIRTVNGLRLAFLAYVNVAAEGGGFDTRTWEASPESPGLAWGTPEAIRADVRAALPQADLVVVMLHSGTEYSSAPNPAQVAAARAAIDAGASLVIGHHAHVLQGIEFYKQGVIIYGLGNFAFENDEARETAILNVWLDPDGVRQLEIVPVTIKPGGEPRLATEAEAAAIRTRVYGLTDLLNPPGIEG